MLWLKKDNRKGPRYWTQNRCSMLSQASGLQTGGRQEEKGQEETKPDALKGLVREKCANHWEKDDRIRHQC